MSRGWSRRYATLGRKRHELRVLFVHGWGFDASLWDKMAACLPEFEIERGELGFLGAPPHLPLIAADMLCIGHSLGVLWLLKQGRPMRGLVSINGFDRFGGQATALRAMRVRLKRDAAGQIADFRRSAGHDDATPAHFDTDRLRQGLGWLADWNCSEARAALDCPVLALAARDDRIASPQLTSASWGDAVIWSENGAHVLPSSRPDWCAELFRNFADAIGPQ